MFGGNKILAIKLLDRINRLGNAAIIKDIIVKPVLRFHNLKGKKEGSEVMIAGIKTLPHIESVPNNHQCIFFHY